MLFQGTLVNAGAVIVGSLVGLLLRQKLSLKLQELLLGALGLSAILIGADLALKTEHMPLVIGSLVVGGVVGHVLGIERMLEAFGEGLKKLVARIPAFSHTLPSESAPAERTEFSVGKAFVTASLVFCIGPLTIMGSLNDGARGDPGLLYTKSALDGPCAMVLTAGMGFGVIFSVVSVVTVQGTLTLVGRFFQEFLTEAMRTEVLAVGGLVTLAIGFELLRIKKLPTANFLPALFFAGLGAWLLELWAPLA